MLTDILPAAARKKVYAIYALVGVVLGALQVAYLNIAGQPQWLTVALAVYGFLGTALGATAASNTPAVKRDAQGRFKGED
jgi:hypothetical protein